MAIHNEPRIIRPGKYLNEALDNLEWKLNSADQFQIEVRKYIDDDFSVNEISPIIKPNLKFELFEENELDLTNFNIGVVYEESVLKESLVMYNENLHVLGSDEITVPFELEKILLWGPQASLFVAIFANKDLPEIDYQHGQIIAKKALGISNINENANFFDVQSATPKDFMDMGYPRNTSYIIEVDPNEISGPFERSGYAIKITISTDLQAIAEDKLFMNEVLMAAFEEVLLVGYEQFTYDELEDDSILKNITARLRAFAGDKDLKSQNIADWAKNREKNKIRSLLQHGLGLNKMFLRSLDNVS